MISDATIEEVRRVSEANNPPPLKLRFPAGFEGAVIESSATESWDERVIAYTMLITDAQALVSKLEDWGLVTFRAVSKEQYERGEA